MMAELDMRQILGNLAINVRITGLRRFRWRLWGAGILIGMAIRMLGSDGEVNVEVI
jgi:hypothetical protein